MYKMKLSYKGKKAWGAAENSMRLKYRRKNAINDRKRQLKNRDKEPNEEQLNKYNRENGGVITPKEEFKWGIFSPNGWKPLNWYGRVMLFKTEQEAKNMLEEINSNGNAYVIREILGW